MTLTLTLRLGLTFIHPIPIHTQLTSVLMHRRHACHHIRGSNVKNSGEQLATIDSSQSTCFPPPLVLVAWLYSRGEINLQLLSIPDRSARIGISFIEAFEPILAQGRPHSLRVILEGFGDQNALGETTAHITFDPEMRAGRVELGGVLDRVEPWPDQVHAHEIITRRGLLGHIEDELFNRMSV